jgi:hypothetical protein
MIARQKGKSLPKPQYAQSDFETAIFLRQSTGKASNQWFLIEIKEHG